MSMSAFAADALPLPDADADEANVAAADAAYVGKLVAINTIDARTGRSAHPEADGAVGTVTAYHQPAHGQPHGTYSVQVDGAHARNSAAHRRLDGQSYAVHAMAVRLVSDGDRLAQCRAEAHLVLFSNMSSDRAMQAANLVHGSFVDFLTGLVNLYSILQTC